MVHSNDKRKRIYELLDMMENNKRKVEKFVVWSRPIAWYIDAGIPFSDSQVDEIHDFLEKLRKEP